MAIEWLIGAPAIVAEILILLAADRRYRWSDRLVSMLDRWAERQR